MSELVRRTGGVELQQRQQNTSRPSKNKSGKRVVNSFAFVFSALSGNGDARGRIASNQVQNLSDSASAGRQRYYKLNWAQTLPVRAPDVRFYLRCLRDRKQMSEKPVLKRKRGPASAARRCAFMSARPLPNPLL